MTDYIVVDSSNLTNVIVVDNPTTLAVDVTTTEVLTVGTQGPVGSQGPQGEIGPQGRPGDVIGKVENITNVDSTNRINGSVLVYAQGTTKWTATNSLDYQNMDAGQF